MLCEGDERGKVEMHLYLTLSRSGDSYRLLIWLFKVSLVIIIYINVYRGFDLGLVSVFSRERRSFPAIDDNTSSGKFDSCDC